MGYLWQVEETYIAKGRSGYKGRMTGGDYLIMEPHHHAIIMVNEWIYF